MPYLYVTMTESRQMVVMDKFPCGGKSTLAMVDKPLGMRSKRLHKEF